MPMGKCASQAGHAYLGAFIKADSTRQNDYHSDGIGTKICLNVKNQFQLERFYEEAKALGLPCCLITDTGRNTTFNGVPTVSAVGIGPLYSHETVFLKKLPLCT